MEKKEIRERVEEMLLKHEENTSEGGIYWDFEWVGGKRIPTGGGGYRQEGGEAVYADKAFYEEMTDFISQELDKAREEGRLLEAIEWYHYAQGLEGCDEFGSPTWEVLQNAKERIPSKLKEYEDIVKMVSESTIDKEKFNKWAKDILKQGNKSKLKQ